MKYFKMHSSQMNILIAFFLIIFSSNFKIWRKKFGYGVKFRGGSRSFRIEVQMLLRVFDLINVSNLPKQNSPWKRNNLDQTEGTVEPPEPLWIHHWNYWVGMVTWTTHNNVFGLRWLICRSCNAINGLIWQITARQADFVLLQQQFQFK